MENKKRLIDTNDVYSLFDKSGRSNLHVADIDLIPRVDAVEVVHGEWGEIYTCHGERLWGYKCSQCEHDNAEKSNYCPNCGAKMDGGNEDA